MFITMLFIITKIWKQPKCTSVDKWIQKSCGTFMQWDTRGCEKEGKLISCDNMAGPRVMLSEINWSEKDKSYL